MLVVVITDVLPTSDTGPHVGGYFKPDLTNTFIGAFRVYTHVFTASII